jgi:hypothetical protein
VARDCWGDGGDVFETSLPGICRTQASGSMERGESDGVARGGGYAEDAGDGVLVEAGIVQLAGGGCGVSNPGSGIAEDFDWGGSGFGSGMGLVEYGGAETVSGDSVIGCV